MTKLTSILLTMFCTPALDEELIGQPQFVEGTILLNTMSMSSAQWMRTDKTRGTLAACVLQELLSAFGEDSPLVTTAADAVDRNRVHLGMDSDGGLNLFFFVQDKKLWLYVFYDPQDDAMIATLADFSAQMHPVRFLDACFSSGLVKEIFAVRQPDIQDALENIRDLTTNQ